MKTMPLLLLAFAGAALPAGCTHQFSNGADARRPSPENQPAGGTEKCENFLEKQLEMYVSSPDGPDGHASKRTAVYDLILPANRDQFGSLDGMAIVGVRVISDDSRDLPVKSVGFVPASQRGLFEVLPPVVRVPHDPVVKLSESSVIRRKYGAYQQELYVFLPVRLLKEQGDLAVELKNRRSVVKLGSFPIQFQVPGVDPGATGSPHGKIDQGLVIALLHRYYCLQIGAS